MKKTEIASVRLDAETLRRLQKLALAGDLSVSELVEELIQQHLAKREAEFKLLREVFGDQGLHGKPGELIE